MTSVLWVAALATSMAASGVTVSFKLDPRLTTGLYMGDRWVSPPTYSRSGQAGAATVTVEARAHKTSTGRTIRISPKWTPSDPEMVNVSPGEGHEVKITVKRAGESTLQVVSEAAATTLAVKAVQREGALKVEVTRKP